jgi:hypothetical protein
MKDFILSLVSPLYVPEICKKFGIIKEVCILPGDIYPSNYWESFIVDLGGTKTWPSPLFLKAEFNSFYNNCGQTVRNW